MSAGLIWLAVGLGLAAVLARRRSVAACLVTAQSLLIAAAAIAVAAGEGTHELVASLVLLLKAVAVGLLLAGAVLRTREARPIRDDVPALARFVATVALMLALVALVPPIGLDSRAAEQGALALVAVGLALLVTRRATLFQVLGLLVAENGISIAALAVPGAMPAVIELGVVFDLILVIAVATVFHGRIFGAFGTTDTVALRRLRD